MATQTQTARVIPMKFARADGEGEITVGIRRVRPEIKGAWAQAQRKLELDEKRRLAQLRREFSRDEWPELYERPELDAEGRQVTYQVEDPHVDADGKPVMITIEYLVEDPAGGAPQTTSIEVQAMRPRRGADGKPVILPSTLPPPQTDAWVGGQMEIMWRMIREAVDFVEVEGQRITKPDDALAAIDDSGALQGVTRAIGRVQAPGIKQTF